MRKRNNGNCYISFPLWGTERERVLFSLCRLDLAVVRVREKKTTTTTTTTRLSSSFPSLLAPPSTTVKCHINSKCHQLTKSMYHGSEEKEEEAEGEEGRVGHNVRSGSIYLSGWDLIHCINSHTHRIDQRREGEDPPAAINSVPCQEIKF